MPKAKELEYSSPFDINEQIYFCGIPFRMDSYNGCIHRCQYCFVRAQELTSANRNNDGSLLLSADSALIRKTIINALDRDVEREDAVNEWLKHRMPIHWGGMSDPFQKIERFKHVSKDIMNVLSYYNYPTVISTKGDVLGDPEYIKLLKEGNYAVQASLISDNDEFMHQIEPGAPLASDRIKMLAKLADAGIWTAIRIQPVIPASIVEYDIYDYITRMVKQTGIKHIIAEAYKVPTKAKNEVAFINKLCPDTYAEYTYPDVKVEGFELVLPSWRKWKYAKIVKQACHDNGITYGAGDNDLRDLGDVVCCCGIDNLKGFEGFWKYQASQAAKIAKQNPNHIVKLADMQQYKFGTKGFGIHNEIIRNKHKVESGKMSTPPWYAVDENWNNGGKDSPECIASMKRITVGGELAYEYSDPIPMLEKKSVEQARMF